MLSRAVNNVGLGAVELSFDNISTSVTNKRPFTQTNIDNLLNACMIAGNNQIAYGTTTFQPIYGCVLAVSEDNWSAAKAYPRSCVVQSSGVALFGGTTTLPSYTSFIGAKIGKISTNGGAHITTGYKCAMRYSKGQVLAIVDTDKIVIDLGPRAVYA